MNWQKIPPLASLRAFEATARLNSFSRAARELNVTHAAISQHVRNLETYFSETLVIRQGRGMATTEKGSALAESLKSGFSIIADGVDELRSHSEIRPINVSLTPAFASNWLIPRMTSFWCQYPNITINLNPSAHAVDLSAGEADMAIRFGKGDWSNLDVTPLIRDTFIVVASSEYTKSTPITDFKDTQDLPWFFQGTMHERKMLMENAGLDMNKASITMFENSDLVLAAVKSGAGLTLQPYAHVEQAISDGSLQNLCELKDDGLGYYIVTKKGRETPSLLTFKKWLLRAAKEA